MIAKIYREADGVDYLWFFCDGCETHHRVPVTGPKAWGWNGSVDAPTVTPSIKTWWPKTRGGDVVVDEWGKAVDHVCHSYVRDGRIEYLADSTHRLAGQTVPLAEMP